MATERLYHLDSYLLEFTAAIVEQREHPQGWAVVLDRTAFFPGGGGQPADQGTLEGQRIIALEGSGDDVLHILADRLGASEVRGGVDPTQRRESIQQHTGQHIISACLIRVGGYRTVSVHMGEAHTTVECDVPVVSPEHLRAVEECANRIVCLNLPVTTHLVPHRELDRFSLRREAAPREEYRIVEIRDTDVVACGGVHAATTGEVGLVACTGSERIRGNTRLSWVIGDRAYRDYALRIDLTSRLGAALSSPMDGLFEAVSGMQERVRELSAELDGAETARAASMAEDLVRGAAEAGSCRMVIRRLSEPAPFAKKLLTALSGHPACVAVLVNDQGERAQLLACVSVDLDVDLGALLTRHLAAVGGRGGGKGRAWQGVITDLGGVDRFIEAVGEQAAKALSD